MSFPPPRVGTARDPSVRTTGARTARVGGALGYDLAPWQRYVADVTGELGEDGHYRYRVVVLHVGRRAGKSALALATLAARTAETPGARCWYTSHRREAAARLWRTDWSPRLRRLPGARVRDSNGSESATVRGTSTLALFAPTRDGLHNADADTVVVDEGWAFTLARGDDVLAAARPAMARDRRAQLWIVSAGGDAASAWLARWLRVARSDATRPPDLALFDWSAGPDDDRADPAVWMRTHPEAGRTVSEDFLRSEYERDPDDFARAYLCVPTGVRDVYEPAFDLTRWGTLLDTGSTSAPPYLAADVAADRSGCAIVAAWTGPPTRVELVDVVPAADAAARIRQLRDRHRPRVVVVDARGPTADLADTLTRQGMDVTRTSYTTRAGADAALFDAIRAGTVAHRGQVVLSDALDAARRRRFGESWLIRRDSTPAAVAIAASLAHDAARVGSASRPRVAGSATG